MKKRKGNKRHKRKYKLYYNSNDLLSTHYIVIDRNVAICTTIVKANVLGSIEFENKIRNFPNNLGYYPKLELLYELNEPEYNVYGYRILVEFDNTADTIEFDETFSSEPIRINDEIIKELHNHLFKIDYDGLDDYDEDDEYE